MSTKDPYDRTVHGWTADGSEIARYGRTGKWYLEPPAATGRKRRQLKIGEAARIAFLGKVVFGRSGGMRFDKLVRDEQRRAES